MMVTQGNEWTRRRMALELMARNTGLTECTISDVESIIQTFAEIYVDAVTETHLMDNKQVAGTDVIRLMLLDTGRNGRDEDEVNQTKMDL